MYAIRSYYDLEQAVGVEGGRFAEDLRIGLEPHARTAAVLHFAQMLHRPLRNAACIGLAVELALARDLDLDMFRQGVDDRDADAVQAAGCLVGLGAELAALV